MWSVRGERRLDISRWQRTFTGVTSVMTDSELGMYAIFGIKRSKNVVCGEHYQKRLRDKEKYLAERLTGAAIDLYQLLPYELSMGH